MEGILIFGVDIIRNLETCTILSKIMEQVEIRVFLEPVMDGFLILSAKEIVYIGEPKRSVMYIFSPPHRIVSHTEPAKSFHQHEEASCSEQIFTAVGVVS